MTETDNLRHETNLRNSWRSYGAWEITITPTALGEKSTIKQNTWNTNSEHSFNQILN